MNHDGEGGIELYVVGFRGVSGQIKSTTTCQRAIGTRSVGSQATRVKKEA